MYSQRVIDLRRAQLERAFDAVLPQGLAGYPVDESLHRAKALASAVDEKGRLVRPLSQDEQTFILVERLRGKIDFRYWARYCVINIAGAGKGPLYPLFYAQELILEAMGAREWEIYSTGYPDGVFAAILKARQYGASTLAEAAIAHRITTHANVHVAIAADTPDTSANLFDMLERTVEHLPWFLKPKITDSVKNDELAFSTDSWASVLAAKSTRGTEGKRGQMGRSFTFGGAHFTELSTWEQATQIDDAFEPTMAMHPQSLWLMESTAKGRGDNWWYKFWHAIKRGKTKRHFLNIFLPWFSDAKKYWLPPPVDWAPNEDTLAHAKRAEEFGPYWMKQAVNLTREQLYWYEHAKAAALEADLTGGSNNALAKFLEEFPADDEEAFQYSGKSVFTIDVRERMRRMQRPLKLVMDVKPAREILRV